MIDTLVITAILYPINVMVIFVTWLIGAWVIVRLINWYREDIQQ